MSKAVRKFNLKALVFFFASIQVDVTVLQCQNQKLVQQLDVQKHEFHGLEAKIKELKDKQASYDGMLITVNKLWNQVRRAILHLYIC
jgi:E3 ubiquitin-protein ligase BRE1